MIPYPVHLRREGHPRPCREHTKAAVVAGGKHVGARTGVIAADPFRGGVKALITGPHGFERTVTFPLDEDPALIAERVRESLEE